jgi:hypothetical protein
LLEKSPLQSLPQQHYYLNMLRNLFFYNAIANLGFAGLLALFPDFYLSNLGWQQVSDETKAVAFMWGAAIQTGMAATQYTISLATLTPHKTLVAHGKVHTVWWTTIGVAVYSQVPELNAFSIGNIAFMFAYAALYGYYSFVQPPKQD